MSKYYDDGPYTIDQWNKLIQDINDKLENPPEGEGCSPLAPLLEVSDPYIWSVDDIEAVQDAMIETCPDISFEEDLEIWHYEIIDEIESQMDDMWCDCEEEQDVGTYDMACLARPYVAATIYSTIWCWCNIFVARRCDYSQSDTGTYYSCIEEWDGGKVISESYELGGEKIDDYVEFTNKALDATKLVESLQSQLDALPHSSPLRAALHAQISVQLAIFHTNYDKMEPTFDEAIEATTECHEAMLNVPFRFPPDKNILSLPKIAELKLNWVQWFNPNSDSEIKKPTLTIYERHTGFLEYDLDYDVDVSLDGKIFSGNELVLISRTYFHRAVDQVCKVVPTDDMPEFPPDYVVLGCYGPCNDPSLTYSTSKFYTWDGKCEEPSIAMVSVQPTDSVEVKYKLTGGYDDLDNTEIQETYWNRFLNWESEHPYP